MAKATEKYSPIDVEVEFWDGKQYDSEKKVGHVAVTPVHDVDGRARGVIYHTGGDPVQLSVGDAVVKQSNGTYTALPADLARATFKIDGDDESEADELEEEAVVALPPPSDDKLLPPSDEEDEEHG